MSSRVSRLLFAEQIFEEIKRREEIMFNAMILNKRFSFFFALTVVIFDLLITSFLRTQKIIFSSETVSHFRYILVAIFYSV